MDNAHQPLLLEDVCRWCDAEIEYFNKTWWVRGTCGNVCEVRPHDGEYDTHEPVGQPRDLPPSLVRGDLERWLDDV